MYSTPLQQTPIDVGTKWLKLGWRAVRSTIERRFGGHAISNSQTFALNACAPGRYVLTLGRGHGHVARELKRKLCNVTSFELGASNRPPKAAASGDAAPPVARLPDNVSWFDEILILDVLDELAGPEVFMRELRQKMARRGSEVIIATANIVSLIRRVLLALGGMRRSAIIRGRHERRPFTFKSLRVLLEQAGYEIVETRGVPMPYPAVGDASRWSRAFVKLNRALLMVSKHLFAHQICVRARPVASVRQPVSKSRFETTALYPSRVKRVA
jgi:hypothetical protein